MKKWISSMFDHRIDIQERTFRLIGSIGLAALLLMLVVSVVIRESLPDILSILGAAVILSSIMFLSLYFHRVQFGATVISILMIFFFLPLVYVSSGGMYGGTPMWFLFSAIFVCMVLRGKIRIILIMGAGLILALCYLLQWYYPRFIIAHSARMAYADSLISTIIVGLMVSLMIFFELMLYTQEQELAMAQRRQIEEINRAQNRFFSNMSHEIRTPVNTILGLNEMIMREATSEEVVSDARSVQGAGRMLLALINDILDMSRIESGKMELVTGPYSTSDVLSEIVDMIWSRSREKGLEFHLDIDESTPKRLIGDDVRIKQILINLLNNAVKYTETGSITLTVETRRLPEPGQVQMIFTVSDTGIGIKKESIPVLFDVFRRMDETKTHYIEGTGLGLSIVKQLVDLMNGEITVNSVYTKGSTFRVAIPQEIADPEEIGTLNLLHGHMQPEIESYKQSFEAPTANLLIVDDNELNLSVAAKLLAATKMNIDTALSGKECLEKTQNKQYHLIFMDHLMPEMDGIACLAAIRDQKGGMNRSTPVVVLTANTGSENQALYRKSGFDGYLLKPVTGAQLEETVATYLPQQLLNRTGISTIHTGEEQVVDVYRKKQAICITTDSVCDMPAGMMKQQRIAVISYRIRTPEGIFVDQTETDTGEILSYMKGNPGKTVEAIAPSIQEYESFFATQLVKADNIVHVSSRAADAVAWYNANEASKAFGNVTIVDSGQISAGIGIVALQAARFADTETLTVAELKELVHRYRANVVTNMVVDSTDRLFRTGRIRAREHSITKNLLIRPIYVPHGEGIRMRGFVGGPRKQYIERYLRNTLSNLEGFDLSTLYILSPDMVPEEAAQIEENIRKLAPYKEILFMQTSAASALAQGSGAVTIVKIRESGS
ncbi:MAG: DegV family EDD domain-containing protein [Lachnospiraceae bacterium]|nr:DegV family EDD domain-containing protein [Lachnospiraceae bacterium]